MRLWELLEDISPEEIKGVERKLDSQVYQPADKVMKQQPVVDLDLPVGSAHFMQRIQQRAGKANITAKEIEDLLARAKLDPRLNLSKRIDSLSREDDPDETITIQDPQSKLTIPVIFRANQQCVRSSDGNPVCLTRQGKAPKNKMIAKTVFRKGVED